MDFNGGIAKVLILKIRNGYFVARAEITRMEESMQDNRNIIRSIGIAYGMAALVLDASFICFQIRLMAILCTFVKIK